MSLEEKTVGYQALAAFRRAIREPELIGTGADGQRWLCLVDLELLYEGYFHRLEGAAATPLTPLHTFTEIIESLCPETRSVPSLLGVLTLSSPQRHTLYLWIAVHHYILYLDDPANSAVKRLIKEGVYAEKAFPKELFLLLQAKLFTARSRLKITGESHQMVKLPSLTGLKLG